MPRGHKNTPFMEPDKIVNVHIVVSVGYEDSYIFVITPFTFLLNKGDLPISYHVCASVL